jgi:hypothetical protein
MRRCLHFSLIYLSSSFSPVYILTNDISLQWPFNMIVALRYLTLQVVLLFLGLYVLICDT